MPVPDHPKIYHITHIENLESIVKDGGLLPDSVMSQRRGVTGIGMKRIKQRRLTKVVPCYPETFVGEYVPFLFCPRSVMLRVIYYANNSELDYQGGQGPVVHLEADMDETIRWAEENNKKWVFSLSNASSCYAEFRNERSQLDEINWNAVAERNQWSGVKDEKQAEFLVRESFPWHLVERIGAYSREITHHVRDIIGGGENNHCPKVEIRQEWYY